MKLSPHRLPQLSSPVAPPPARGHRRSRPTAAVFAACLLAVSAPLPGCGGSSSNPGTDSGSGTVKEYSPAGRRRPARTHSCRARPSSHPRAGGRDRPDRRSAHRVGHEPDAGQGALRGVRPSPSSSRDPLDLPDIHGHCGSRRRRGTQLRWFTTQCQRHCRGSARTRLRPVSGPRASTVHAGFSNGLGPWAHACDRAP